MIDLFMFLVYSTYSVIRLMHGENTVLGLKNETDTDMSGTYASLGILNVLIILLFAS